MNNSSNLRLVNGIRGHLDFLAVLSLSSITLISGLILSSSIVSADDDSVIDNVSVNVEQSCNLTGTGMNSHTAVISPGTYYDGDNHEGIGTTTLKAYCNDTGGFSIYAIGYTGEQYTGENHTKLVGVSNNTNTISTGVYSQGTTTDSVWSMKLATASSPTATYPISIVGGFDSYHAVPDTYTKVAERQSGTDVGATAEGSTLTATYSAYISSIQAADTYNGKVKYTMVHPYTEEPLSPQPSTAGCINYFANASSAVGTMGCQSASDGNTIELLASNFSRTGYGFAGWSDAFDYATNPNAHFYGPQETITVPTGTSSNGLSLYAVWVKSEGSLQDSSKVASVCSNLTAAPTDGTAKLTSISALTDQRDNETYAVAKLADGQCWMIENLRLESTNSDDSTGALAQGYGTSTTYGNFSGLANAENANFSNSTTANSLYYSGTQSDTASVDIGTTNYPGYRMPRYNSYNHQTASANRPQNPTQNTAANSTTKAGIYSYGNYYTWSAAIADTSYYNTNNSSVTNTSLCPKGWHLPIGGRKANVATSDFWKMSRATIGSDPANFADDNFYYTGTPEGTEASNKLRSFPNNFLYSGVFNGSSATSRGSYGYYWSSTASRYGDSYYLRLISSFVTPGTYYNDKYLGCSIRCIAGS